MTNMFGYKQIKKVSKQIRGVTYKKSDISETPKEGYIPLLRANNIAGRRINYDELVFIKQESVRDDQLLENFDILIATSSGSKKIVGKSAQYYISKYEKVTFGAFCKVVRPDNKDINPRYLGCFFQTEIYRRNIDKVVTGSNINNLRNEHIDKQTLLVPNFEVQCKIADVIESSETIIEKRQQQIEALSALKQSVYYDMLNSFKKEKFKLKDILKIDTVTMKDFTENPEYYLIGIDNIEKDTGRIINHKKITETSVKGSKHYFNEKHVLYSKIRPYLNKVATPTFEGVCSTDCYPLLVDETKATKEFVVLLLRSQEFVSYANSQSTGANIPRINQTKLLNYNFLMPNLEIQHRIKEKVNKIDQSILLMENSLEQINLLYDSILHKAFNGELFKEDINV